MGQAAGGDILAQEAVLGVAIGLITKKPGKGSAIPYKRSCNIGMGYLTSLILS